MKTSDYIRVTIDRLPKGYIFTYVDFTTEVNKKEAVIKALNRLAESGRIIKLAKGKFYKPENTPFGNILPNQYQIVKDLLEDNGKIIGYLTGYSIYNKLGLSTQVSNIIQIGKNEIRPAFQRERYMISFVKQKNNITKENIPLLQLLDSIRNIKKIPDTNIAKSGKRIIEIVKSLSKEDKDTIVRLALKYSPVVRAILGAMLDEISDQIYAETLKRSLNPITKYKIEGIQKVLKQADKWNIS